MEHSLKQEEDINKLVDEGIIQDKNQFIIDAISNHLNKPQIKKELKKLNKKTNGHEKDIQIRVGLNFNNRLEEIKKKVDKLKKYKKRMSNAMITNLIPKHDNWPKIEEDLINYDFNK